MSRNTTGLFHWFFPQIAETVTWLAAGVSNAGSQTETNHVSTTPPPPSRKCVYWHPITSVIARPAAQFCSREQKCGSEDATGLSNLTKASARYSVKTFTISKKFGVPRPMEGGYPRGGSFFIEKLAVPLGGSVIFSFLCVQYLNTLYREIRK